ncbi:Uncharacterized protein TCM_024740 [Theobroma cacao]|uniref:Myb/SANT-like domain-containing protein n=1 Tax=Theobroma cacao TaxID=3641 RepID=A0A061EY18_THECC|nr:Uncharacterized protein TCM_024740 [Theobroma cacao]
MGRKEGGEIIKSQSDFTLTDGAQKGNKPSNVFNASSYIRVLQAINEKFNVQCKTNHVENHLRIVKNTSNTVQNVLAKSGFGWDDNLKMITADRQVYEDEAHLKHEPFINKKIDMFNEMTLVVGKDMATESFAKSFADIDFQTNTEANAMLVDLDKDVDEEMRGR